MFVEEVGYFTFGIIQRCPPKQNIHSIHIRSISNSLFDGFNISFFGSLVNIHTRPTPHNHHGCDCD